MKEEDNVLRILKETRVAIEKNDSFNLKNLSNRTVNTSSLTQDSDNIAVAVIVYSLSKIIERQDYRQLSGWNVFYKRSNVDGTIFHVLKKNLSNVVQRK